MDLLRRIFINRAHRLFVLYLAFIAIALCVALLVPLWQMLLGPMAYGFAHLFCSVRYFHLAAAGEDVAAKRRGPLVYGFLAGTSVLYVLYRAARSAGWVPGITSRLSEWQGSALVDGLFMLTIFLGAFLIYRRSLRRLVLGLGIVAPLTYLLWTDPYTTAGALVLGHNVVAFVYWLLVARPGQDRRYAWLAFGIFLGINGLLFAGAFDPILEWLARDATLDFAGLSAAQIGFMITPWSRDPDVWLHAAVAFAFGQSTHYYVWFKAIPDECHHNRIPTTFKQSWRLLREDFGTRAAALVVYAVLAASLVWVFLAVPRARALYFLVAGFHGYLEIAGLGLVRRAQRSGGAAERAVDEPAPA
ncbi:MAG: hypothetical protein M5U28_21785 [Sandaracinaceae bacterium]|nr:hypothetical protein [Sandaracinaceae bacterium]